MPWDTLIRNGEVVLRDGVPQMDIAIENGQIVELAGGLRGSAREEVNATGLHVFPGVIDPHVHFNEPGRTDWEGWATGSAALSAGGGTCCFEMPLNANPPTLDGPSFDLKRAAAEASSRTDFALWGGLTPDNLDKLDELADRGVIGFKAFMSGSGIAEFKAVDDYTLYRGMEYAAKRGMIVAVHAENDQLTAGLAAEAIRNGQTNARDYLRSRPDIAELEAIQRAVLWADKLRCDLHVVHVSTVSGVNAVKSGRDDATWTNDPEAREYLITCETCPHYLVLNESDVVAIGAAAKCAPPIRSEDRAWQLRDALLRDEIDFVASDHSPAPASMKMGDDFFRVWGGIAGIQSTLPALLSLHPRPSPTLAAKLTAANVAERFGVANKGEIKTGFDADLALVDLNASYTLTRDMLLDRHKLSPYVGRTFRGLVKRTIARGHTIFLDGKSVGASHGRLIKPREAAR